MPPRRPEWATILLAGVLSLIFAPLSAMAQGSGGTVFDGVLDQTDADEVKQWAEFYWARVDEDGTPHVDAEQFAFTNSALNSPLFNPLRAYRPMLELLNEIDPGLCDLMTEFGWNGIPDEIDRQRQVLRAAMLTGTVATDAVDNPMGTIEHLNLVMAAPNLPDLEVEVEGGVLISTNLPLIEVDFVAAEIAAALDVSAHSQYIIAALAVSAPNWVAQATGASEARSLITGEPSKADTFAQSVYAWLEVVASAELADDSISVERLDAHFAVYGQLPVVLVKLPDAFVLIDAVNGNVAGPYDPTSDMDARPLLSVHNQDWLEAGARFHTRLGCVALVPPGWQDVMPTPWTPAFPVPGAIPPDPQSRPGHWTDYVCQATVGGRCMCESTGSGTTPGPPVKVWETRVRCICSPDPTHGCTPPGNPGFPGTPPAAPIVLPALLPGCTCKQQWKY